MVDQFENGGENREIRGGWLFMDEKKLIFLMLH